MGKLSNSPDKYWRTGVAMSIERKPIFDKRLEEAGLETVGDLVSFFTFADGAVEAIKPLVEVYKNSKENSRGNKTIVNQLKGMTPEQIKAALAAAGVNL